MTLMKTNNQMKCGIVRAVLLLLAVLSQESLGDRGEPFMAPRLIGLEPLSTDYQLILTAN